MGRMGGANRAKAETLHGAIVALRQEGFTQDQIGAALQRGQSVIAHHLNRRCKCESPRYAYVPESWFLCRLCGGDWRSKNGCRHEWKLTI